MTLLSEAESELSAEALAFVRKRAEEDAGSLARALEAASASPFAPRLFVIKRRQPADDYLAGLIGKQ